MKNSPKQALPLHNEFDDYFLFSYVCKVFSIKEPSFLNKEKQKIGAHMNMTQNMMSFEANLCSGCSRKQAEVSGAIMKEVASLERRLKETEEELNDVKNFLRSIVERLTGLNLALASTADKKQGPKNDEKHQSHSSKLLHYKLLNESLEKNIKSYQKMRNTLIHNVLGNPLDIQKSLNLTPEEKTQLKTQLEEDKIDESDPTFQRIMLAYEQFCAGTLSSAEEKPAPLVKKSDEKKQKKIASNYPLSPRTKSPIFSPLVLKSQGSSVSQVEIRDSLVISPSVNKPSNALNGESRVKSGLVSELSDDKLKRLVAGSQSTKNSGRKKIEFPDPERGTDSQKKLRTGSPPSVFKTPNKFKEV